MKFPPQNLLLVDDPASSTNSKSQKTTFKIYVSKKSNIYLHNLWDFVCHNLIKNLRILIPNTQLHFQTEIISIIFRWSTNHQLFFMSKINGLLSQMLWTPRHHHHQNPYKQITERVPASSLSFISSSTNSCLLI